MNVDPKKINLSEKDIEEYIYNNPSVIKTPFNQEEVISWFGRQLKVPNGIIDLIGIAPGDKIILVELKNTTFESEHLTQICRYADDIESVGRAAGMLNDMVLYKLLIGIQQPSTKIIAEANALNVFLMTIEIQYNLEVSGFWRFSKEYENQREEKIKELSSMEIFKRLAKGSIESFNFKEDDNG